MAEPPVMPRHRAPGPGKTLNVQVWRAGLVRDSMVVPNTDQGYELVWRVIRLLNEHRQHQVPEWTAQGTEVKLGYPNWVEADSVAYLYVGR